VAYFLDHPVYYTILCPTPLPHTSLLVKAILKYVKITTFQLIALTKNCQNISKGISVSESKG